MFGFGNRSMHGSTSAALTTFGGVFWAARWTRTTRNFRLLRVFSTQVFARIMRPKCCGHTDEPTITLRTRRHIVVAFIKELEGAP